MAHEPKDVQQRAPIDDSTAVVLHARKTTFVMLIVTALVVIGILVEDVSRLKRAVDDADTIQGLMNLWRSETRDKDGPVSVAHILAGPVSAAPGAKRRFRLGLAPSSDSKGDALISCTVGLDLGQRFFVPENGQVQKIVVRASNKFESGREINVEWRSHSGEARWTEWLLKQPPYNLRSFSKFWDMLVSSGGSARVNATEIKKYLLQGLSAFDEDITFDTSSKEGHWVVSGLPNFKVASVKVFSDDAELDEQEITIAPVDRYVRSMDFGEHGQPLSIYVSRVTDWNERIEEWTNAETDTAAVGLCHGIGDSEAKLYPVVFPVKFQNERFDWTEAWIERAFEHGHLSKELQPGMSNRLRLPFVQAFANLHREAEGLESLELDALHGWLQRRLDRQGNRIEVAGIGIPRTLIRSLGLFLILVVQVYTATHLSEAVFRMKRSAASDPGAFQAWIVLYDGLLSLCAAVGIVVAPAAAALVVIWVLHGGAFWTFYALVSGIGLVFSLMLASYSVRKVFRLRAETQRHRKCAERYRTEASSQEARQEPVGSGQPSEPAGPSD